MVFSYAALSLPPPTHTHTHIHKHVLHKPFCSQMSWEREANVPFHLKQRTHTHTVSVGRGVSLCRNAGMISCGGVRGETHAVTARHLKTLHPKASNSSDFSLYASILSFLFNFSFCLHHLCPFFSANLNTTLRLPLVQTLHPLVCFNL